MVWEAAASATRERLPSGTEINLVSAPAFLATKFEAFHSRGGADPLLSHDFEDIVNVVEGRLSIADEVDAAPLLLRAYLGTRFAEVVATPDFANILPGLVAFDDLYTERLVRLTQRIQALALLGTP